MLAVIIVIFVKTLECKIRSASILDTFDFSKKFKMCLQKCGIILFLVSVSGSGPIRSWTGIQTNAESECFAPHLQTPVRYNFVVHHHLWNDAPQIIGNNETSDIRIFVSTQPLALANFERSWLHRVKVQEMHAVEISWLSRGVTLDLIQYDCSQLVALPMANENLSSHAQSFLRRIVAMLPLSLPVSLTPNGSNTEVSTEEHFQGELILCSNWNKSTLPHLLNMQVSVLDVAHRRHTTKTWLEEDEDGCGDTMLYSVSTEMTKNMLLSLKMSVQRLLMPSICRLRQNPMLCHENMAPGNEELRTVVANLTFAQQREASGFDTEVEGQADLLLVDIASCTHPVGRYDNKEPSDGTDVQVAGTALLDLLFGGKGNGQLFLAQHFQQSPIFGKRFAGKLVENLSIDKMLNDYRNQNQMHLVRIDKCKIAARPNLDNETVALGLVSNFNCTIKLSFEQLPNVHIFTEIQSKLESEILCPVTAHVYVSPRDIKALNIHTDPYDVFVIQIQGSKLWKICLPLPPASLANSAHARKCLSPADHALRREMHSWNGLGGTNYVGDELDSMDCQYVETRAGDTLYIPRNFVHVAEATSQEPSIHVTFGLQEAGHRWKDFILLAVQSVVCFGGCDGQIVDLINNAIIEMSNQKRDKHLDADRYKWYQAFPLLRCAVLKAKDNDPWQIDQMCSQQFAEFEKLIHDLDAVVLADLKGHIFHAARHHLKQTRTMGIFLKVTHHMLDKVAQDILHSTPGNTSVQVSPVIPVQYVWAQRILESEGTRLKMHAAAEVDAHKEAQQRRARRDAMFDIIDKDKSGSVSVEEFKGYVSKFGGDLEAGTTESIFENAATNNEMSHNTFLLLPPMHQKTITSILPNVSAVIIARFPYLFQDLQSLQGKDSGVSSVGVPRAIGRSLLSTASRSLLSVNQGDPWAINIGGCTSSCDTVYSCGNDGSCDNGGCDGGGYEWGCDNDWDCTSGYIEYNHVNYCYRSDGGYSVTQSCDHTCSSFDCGLGSYETHSGCHACTTAACPMGQYRETCQQGQAKKNADCAACTNAPECRFDSGKKETDPIYISAGSPAQSNNCAWEAQPGFRGASHNNLARVCGSDGHQPCATEQSTVASSGVATRAVDGNRETQWESNSCTHTSEETDPWWKLDLGQVRTVSTVSVWNRGDCCHERLDNFDIRIGNVPTSFAENPVCATGVAAPQSSPYSVNVPCHGVGRYLFIVVPGNKKILTLCEVEVNDHTCSMCLPDTYSPTSGRSDCSQCEAGKFQLTPGMTECAPCNVGTYKNVTSSGSGKRVFNPPDSARSYSSFYSPQHTQSMLDSIGSIGSWSSATLTVGEFLEIDVGEPMDIWGIITQGRATASCCSDQYVTRVKVEYRLDYDSAVIPLDWEFACTQGDVHKENLFPSYVRARYVRIIVLAWNTRISMRAALLVGSIACTLCPAGTFQDQPGQTNCVECAVGKYSTSAESIDETTCKHCPVGKFSNQSGLSGCASCPIGKYKGAEGRVFQIRGQSCQDPLASLVSSPFTLSGQRGGNPSYTSQDDM